MCILYSSFFHFGIWSQNLIVIIVIIVMFGK